MKWRRQWKTIFGKVEITVETERSIFIRSLFCQSLFISLCLYTNISLCQLFIFVSHLPEKLFLIPISLFLICLFISKGSRYLCIRFYIIYLPICPWLNSVTVTVFHLYSISISLSSSLSNILSCLCRSFCSLPVCGHVISFLQFTISCTQHKK